MYRIHFPTVCTPIPNYTGTIVCTTATDSKATDGCSAGFYKESTAQGDVCKACTSINNYTGALVCTNATDSKATGTCKAGFYKDSTGQADVCTGKYIYYITIHYNGLQ